MSLRKVTRREVLYVKYEKSSKYDNEIKNFICFPQALDTARYPEIRNILEICIFVSLSYISVHYLSSFETHQRNFNPSFFNSTFVANIRDNFCKFLVKNENLKKMYL